MSSQTYAISEEGPQQVSVSKTIRPSVPWHHKLWFRVFMGCCLAVIGAAKVCKGFVLLTGATNYGCMLEFNHGDLYYTSAVSKEDVKRLGDFLVEEKFFDGRHVSVQLTNNAQTIQVRFPVKSGFEKDESYVVSVHALGVRISQKVFHGRPIEIDLCDSQLKTRRAILIAVAAT
jgi:hypothetical protein